MPDKSTILLQSTQRYRILLESSQRLPKNHARIDMDTLSRRWISSSRLVYSLIACDNVTLSEAVVDDYRAKMAARANRSHRGDSRATLGPQGRAQGFLNVLKNIPM